MEKKNIMELVERDGHVYLGIGENGVAISDYSLTDSMNGGMTLDVTTMSGGKARIKSDDSFKVFQFACASIDTHDAELDAMLKAAGWVTLYITGKGMAALAAVEPFFGSNSSLETENERRILTRYCEYIAAHGYEGGAEAALAEVDALTGKDSAVAWVCDTYSRYVTDDNALLDALKEAETPATGTAVSESEPIDREQRLRIIVEAVSGLTLKDWNDAKEKIDRLFSYPANAARNRVTIGKTPDEIADTLRKDW